MAASICLPDTMLAYVVEGESASVQTVPVPSPAPGECLVKVSRSGICNTDLEILKGYMGFKGVLGHEVPAARLASLSASTADVCLDHRCTLTLSRSTHTYCPLHRQLLTFGSPRTVRRRGGLSA